MRDYFVALDRNYDIAFVNRSLAEGSAARFPNLIGRNQWELWPEMRGTAVESSYERAFRTGLPERFEFFHEKSGFWLELDVYPTDGYLLIYFRDISVRKLRERERLESEEMFRSIVDALPQIAWAAGTDGPPAYFNARWWEYTGLDPNEPYDPAHVIHPEDFEKVMEIRDRAYARGETYRTEVRLRRHDGQYRWHLTRAEPLRDAQGKIVRYLGTSTDFHAERTSADTSRAIVAGMAAPVIVLTTDGTVVASNDAWHRLYRGVGQRGDDVSVFSKAFEVMDEDGKPLPREAWSSTRAGDGTAADHLVRLLHLETGNVIFSSHHAVPIEVNGERLVVVTATDLTDVMAANNALRQSELRMRRLLETATVGVIVTDLAGKFLYVNSPLLKMLGYDEADFEAGRLGWDVILAPDFADRDREAVGQLHTVGTCEPYESVFIAQDGRRVPIFVGAAMLPDENDEGTRGAAFVTDLTPLKAAEEELRALNHELDHRVQERTSELRRANEELEAFTYHVSHDLRAPLRAIVSTSRLLQEDYREVLTEEGNRLLERQITAGNKLARLIDELLRLSRLARETVHPEHVDLTALARELATEHAQDNERVTIVVNDGMEAEGDPRLLRLLLANLLSNALRYSPGGGTVTVGHEETMQGETFYVKDEGIGFDMQYADKLFKPFERLVTDAEFEGTGVGLANAARIVAKHRGRLWAESTVGKGSKFMFTLC